jgi:PAS domain S-box-containing protein
MTVKQPDTDTLYLPVASETGRLIRNKDWSESPIGAPSQWPQSLKTSLGILLVSKVPMLLWWGPELICFFNDAYFPFLGENKKPSEILGAKAEEVFQENWQITKDLTERVLSGNESIDSEDQLLSFLRNAKRELIWCQLTYNPVAGEHGKPEGILVAIAETKGKTLLRKKLEEKLNIVIEASELAIWELDLKTRAGSFSDRYLEILGYEAGTVLTHAQILKHIHPDDMPIREQAFKVALATGILHYEARIIWNDGSLHWIEGKGKVFYDDEHSPVNMIGTLRDVTDEKNYRRELEDREQKFRLLANSMPQHIWTSDTEGNLNYFNDSVYEYSGLNQEQINKDGWVQIVHPDDREENLKQWLTSISTGKDFLFEHRFRKHTGEYRWQLSRAIPQRDENGNIRMWVGTSTDIQDQKTFARELELKVNERTKALKQLNEDLKKSEERYHLMVEEVQDYAILYLNKEGMVENWNAGAEKIKGYQAKEIIGRNFSVFYTQPDREDGLPQKLLRLAKETGRARQEGWRVRKDGSLFWASVVITAVHNETNDVIGYSKVTHDLTEKKEANDKLILNAAQLEQRNEELRKMNKELESFAYISSHDLQEPLRKIQTFATRIAEKESANLSDYGKDYFNRMQNAAVRMQMLIDDLLAYSRTNTAERKYETTELSVIIEEVKADLKEEIFHKNATIEANELCTIDVIPFQFRQLMYNLIANSLKFSLPDRPPHISIKCDTGTGDMFKNDKLLPTETYCHISVSDNGIGFEEQYQEKIFELFQRLHNRTTYVGTGIGLAIVKKIVENHNGIITATGQVDKGATFDIYLPTDL